MAGQSLNENNQGAQPASIEQRYIQLLEARTAFLEQSLTRSTTHSQPQYQPQLHSQLQIPFHAQYQLPHQPQHRLQHDLLYQPQHQQHYHQTNGEAYFDSTFPRPLPPPFSPPPPPLLDNVGITANGIAVSHDLAREGPSNATADGRMEANRLSTITFGNEKTVENLGNGGGVGGGDRSYNQTTDGNTGEQETDLKSINAVGIDKEKDGVLGNAKASSGIINSQIGRSPQEEGKKPDDTKARNDNTDEQKNGSTHKTRRIRTVVNRWNREKRKWEDLEDEFEKSKDTPDKAATFRRHMDASNEMKVDLEVIEIHSQSLKNLMAETDEWWGDVVKESTHQVTVDEPFHPFVWEWDRYVKACEPKDSDTRAIKEARQDLEGLMQLITSSNSLESYFRSRDLLMNSKKIKFDYLWTLFRHGTKVYARPYMNELQMFEVKGYSESPYEGNRFRISCSAFDWDGSKFSTYNYDFYIKEFAGEKPINSLGVFPTEFFCNDDGNYDDSQLRQQLFERGRKYCELCTEEASSFQCEYQGTAIVTPSGLHRLTSKGRGEDALSSYSDPPWAQYDGQELDVTSIDITGKQSRVIIDNYAFLKSERNTMKRGDMPPLGKKLPYFEPGCVCAICKSSPLQQWRPESRLDHSLDGLGQAFSEDETRLLFLPPRLLGYALKDKVWGQFLVDKLTRFSLREQMDPFWGELQLEKESKELLMAYVKHHKAPSLRKSAQETGGIDSKAFDVIEGKGQGLAILLHGPPGVGKTLTAETIALATSRPLLTVSVAEIGVEAHEAERKLTDVFVDAARWEAVLLMDEADVFVEERIKGDLGRNALVSVLLRCLEYYDGIIILTTNRVRSIDAAVQSRIHLAIQYHDLTTQQRLAIYKNRLKWIPDEEIEDRKTLEKGLETSPLTKKSNKANGRQIRNIVTGARALAKSKNQRLTLEHLVTVDETTSNFINSMADLMQKQRARNEIDYEQ